MKDSIIVSVSELRSLVQDVRRSGKEYVELSISEPSIDEDGTTDPTMLFASAFNPNDTDMCIDFEPIYAPEDESELSRSILFSSHMSSNLL
jgi:hypothetical protein